MTDAAVEALEAGLKREDSRPPLLERIEKLTQELRRQSQGPRRDMTKDEIDAMWGHD